MLADPIGFFFPDLSLLLLSFLCLGFPGAKAKFPSQHTQLTPTPLADCRKRRSERGAARAAARGRRLCRLRWRRPLGRIGPGVVRGRSGASFQCYLPHSVQASFFLENLRNPRENGWFLKRTMVEKNGESFSRAG